MVLGAVMNEFLRINQRRYDDLCPRERRCIRSEIVMLCAYAKVDEDRSDTSRAMVGPNKEECLGVLDLADLKSKGDEPIDQPARDTKGGGGIAVD